MRYMNTDSFIVHTKTDYIYKGIAENVETTIAFLVCSDFLKFYEIFLSPQMKRCTIITYKHGIYG